MPDQPAAAVPPVPLSGRQRDRREFALPCRPASATAARHLVGDALRRWQLDQLVDAASLATTELVSNAVRHARTHILLSISVTKSLQIAVADEKPGPVDALPDPPHLAEDGRGLQLVGAVSQEWGWTPRGTGKEIWFRLPLPQGYALPE